MNFRVIVDTDAGSDDFMAIAFLLHQSDFSIEAITIVHGVSHIDTAVRNIRVLLQSVGKMEIPVYVGQTTSLLNHRSFPEDWKTTAGNIGQYFNDGGGNISSEYENEVGDGDAVQFLTKRLLDTHRPFKLLALGPLSNIALAFRSLISIHLKQNEDLILQQDQPTVMTAIEELVIMGGAFACRGNVHKDVGSNGDDTIIHGYNEFAEWNIFADPEAAHEVMDCIQQRRIAVGKRVVLIGLDATNRVPFHERDILTLRTATSLTPSGHAISRILESNLNYIRHGTFFAWDPLAAVYLVEPAIVTLHHARLGVEVVLNEPEIGRTKFCVAAVASLSSNTITSSSSSSTAAISTGLFNSDSVNHADCGIANISNIDRTNVIYVAMDADAERFTEVFYKAFIQHPSASMR